MPTENDLSLDPKDFTLSAYDAVAIVMPERELASDADIEAELFSYVANSSPDEGITSIADLDNAWVQRNFNDLATVAELKDAIRYDLEKDSRFAWENLKFQKCGEALIARLQGDIPEETVKANVDAVRAQYDERLRSFGITKQQYLRDERMTEQEYEEKLEHDVRYQLALNVALDKMIEITTTTVANNEICDYLSTDNPEAFIKELQEKNKVEEARRAAARVKVMRRIVETAEISTEGETEEAPKASIDG